MFAASSSTRLATVFCARLTPSKSFFSEHKMCVALNIQSFINTLFVKRRDDFESSHLSHSSKHSILTFIFILVNRLFLFRDSRLQLTQFILPQYSSVHNTLVSGFITNSVSQRRFMPLNVEPFHNSSGM